MNNFCDVNLSFIRYPLVTKRCIPNCIPLTQRLLDAQRSTFRVKYQKYLPFFALIKTFEILLCNIQVMLFRTVPREHWLI